MVEEDILYVTAEGLKQINEELINLKTARREEVAQKLEIAIKQGDLKENADYHEAKEEQCFIEYHSRQLESMLGSARLIEAKGPSNIVRVGNTVTVSEDGIDEMETYTIVGAHEADPTKGRISNESPIGSALLGAKKGQMVKAMTPAGEIRFTIHEIA